MLYGMFLRMLHGEEQLMKTCFVGKGGYVLSLSALDFCCQQIVLIGIFSKTFTVKRLWFSMNKNFRIHSEFRIKNDFDYIHRSPIPSCDNSPLHSIVTNRTNL